MNDLNLTREKLLALYQQMLLIRKVEERLSVEVRTGDIPGTVHLYIGQEAVAAGICAHLTDDDKVASNHRGHGHYLAKGGEPSAMVAEIYGRATGICGGKGGSMHVADVSRGMLGANGIVGGGIGLAVGAALAALLDGKGHVSVAFFGDGGANQGILMEALNLAAVWRLPLLLVCENNGFSEFSPSDTVTAGRIVDRSAAFGVPGVEVDGNDAVAVWTEAGRAVARARSGQGPTLIEARTYRIRGHVETEETFLPMAYREESEVEDWRKRDPICRLEGVLAERHPDADLVRIQNEIDKLVDVSFKFAKASAPAVPDAGSAGAVF